MNTLTTDTILRRDIFGGRRRDGDNSVGGARQKLTGEEARSDVSQSQQIVRQMRTELEEVLRILRR